MCAGSVRPVTGMESIFVKLTMLGGLPSGGAASRQRQQPIMPTTPTPLTRRWCPSHEHECIACLFVLLCNMTISCSSYQKGALNVVLLRST